jgi:hypothetical protein
LITSSQLLYLALRICELVAVCTEFCLRCLGANSQLLDLALRIQELLGGSGDLSIFLLNDVFGLLKVSRDGAEERIGKGNGRVLCSLDKSVPYVDSEFRKWFCKVRYIVSTGN